jgi:PQQ enzyme repeat
MYCSTLSFDSLDGYLVAINANDGKVVWRTCAPASRTRTSSRSIISVMSRRVFGRQLDGEAINSAVDAARPCGTPGFVTDYIRTAKNANIRALYPTLGFTQFDRTAGRPAATPSLLTLADYVPQEAHIERIGAPR